MKCLIVIPARGKSKGIPKKNLRIMNGYPLIYYSIQNALSLKEHYDVDVAVDTDDAEIAEVAGMAQKPLCGQKNCREIMSRWIRLSIMP